MGARRFVAFIGMTAASALVLAACGGGGGSGSGSAQETLKIGIIADVTGPAAQGEEYVVQGAQARVDALNDAGGVGGRKVELVVGDTASSPQGTLTAAKKLVQQDDVQAIVSWTYLFNSAASFVTSQGVPVFGGSWDSSPGWATHENMFGLQPGQGQVYVNSTTWPTLFTQQGISRLGVVGFGNDSAKQATESIVKSAEAAGIPAPYVNETVQPTDADFTATALAVKNSGVDGVFAVLPAGQVYLLSTALHQQGVALKSYIGATGYGQSLLDNPTALQGSDGATFQVWYAPKELNTPATQTMSANLANYAQFPGSFDFSAAGGYLSADAALAAAGRATGDLTKESILAAAKTMNDWDAGGLLAHAVDWTKPDAVNGSGLAYGNCTWYVRVSGNSFTPVNQEPTCGTATAVS
jgi:branched-chain amino acid transport system substrate-binding protein